MGEIVLSWKMGEKVLESKEAESETQKQKGKDEVVEESGTESKGDELNNGLMRWERFLPKMVLRVLLVEADDSTRQIITALLRKCSYRVAAVPDGLTAWEILKGRPEDIDLILTEVDLPSISGYALLTLIGEHEICKNTPVIMMSSQDSISTVYTCMLRGAADYLVKPVRKNELRNLWQHVWRRQSSTAGVNGPQDESVAQQKVEATAENNAPGNNSTGNAACTQRNKELIEKASDAQSSCTKPELEAESALMDNGHESESKHGESYPIVTKMQDVEKCVHLGQTLIMHDNHSGDSAHGKYGEPEHFRSPDTSGEVRDNHYVQITSSKEAIDLIGIFQNRPNYSHKSSSVNCTGEFDFSPQLDLSLRRSQPSNFENEATKERHTLRHSNASAFKRYTNSRIQAPPAVLVNCSEQNREQRTNCEKNVSNIVGYNSDSSTLSMGRSIVSPTTPPSKESELTTFPTQHCHSLPIPVKGIKYNHLSTAYGSVLPSPVFCTQSGPPTMPGLNLVPHLEPSFQVNAFYQSSGKENSSEQLYEPFGQSGNNATNQIVSMQEHKVEHVEDRRHVSPTNDQSAGSNSNVDQVAIVRAATESKSEDLTNNGISNRSIQREAALNKFRLKRKERCFEKKVRYESRKKLAEQRPRVKGQFVRQVQLDPQDAEKNGK